MSLMFWISLWTRMDSLRPSSIFVFSQLPGDPVREQVTLSFRVAENSSFNRTHLFALIQSKGGAGRFCFWAEYVCYSLSHVWLFVTLWTVAHPAPLSMGFSRQEYWSGLPFLSPGALPMTYGERDPPTHLGGRDTHTERHTQRLNIDTQH